MCRGILFLSLSDLPEDAVHIAKVDVGGIIVRASSRWLLIRFPPGQEFR